MLRSNFNASTCKTRAQLALRRVAHARTMIQERVYSCVIAVHGPQRGQGKMKVLPYSDEHRFTEGCSTSESSHVRGCSFCTTESLGD